MRDSRFFRQIARLVWLALLAACAASAFAAAPDADLEARATHMEERLRCLVCQNQSIAESSADLATDLKRQVREMLAAGKSEDEIKTFMVDRYGDFVLYEPPVKTSTLILWLGPLTLLLAALAAFFWRLRKRNSSTPPPRLSEAERAQAQALLDTKAES